MKRRPTMTPGTVAPPDHRTDGPCSCDLCAQLERAMANPDPDPDPGRGYREAWASEMANARKAIEREDEIRASGKYREGQAGEVIVGLSGIGWPPTGLGADERAEAMGAIVSATEDVGGYAAELAKARERRGDFAPAPVQVERSEPAAPAPPHDEPLTSVGREVVEAMGRAQQSGAIETHDMIFDAECQVPFQVGSIVSDVVGLCAYRGWGIVVLVLNVIEADLDAKPGQPTIGLRVTVAR